MKRVRTADGSITLYSERYGQTFHSEHGAITEARHVFLEASGVRERLEAGLATRVLEVGFGTGLNFLVTARAAIECQAELSYAALERDLISPDVIETLDHGPTMGDTSLQEALLTLLRSMPDDTSSGRHSTQMTPEVHLSLILGDAESAELPATMFDAVYLDAFSPRRNPELWTTAFLVRLFTALVPGGKLTTYSASGAVRRTLAEVGFTVEKLPGPPGGKREMSVAMRPG